MLDRETGEIWMTECKVPIRPRMTVKEFLAAFASSQGVHCGEAMCIFRGTRCVGGTHFHLHLYFDADEQIDAEEQKLRSVWMFYSTRRWEPPTGWRKWLPTFSPIIGNEADELACKTWLRAHVSQTLPEQLYRWGYLRLRFWRSEDPYIQVEYFDHPLVDWE